MPTLQDKEDSLMKLNSKRIDFEYTPDEEIFTFPEDTGLPFLFDVDEELTDNPSAMDAVGEMLDEAETLAEKAKAAIKAALSDQGAPYHDLVTFFMQFHRDDVGSDIAADLFREPIRPSCPLSRWWTFCGSSVLAAWWMAKPASKPLFWTCLSTRKSPTS